MKGFACADADTKNKNKCEVDSCKRLGDAGTDTKFFFFCKMNVSLVQYTHLVKKKKKEKKINWGVPGMEFWQSSFQFTTLHIKMANTML